MFSALIFRSLETYKTAYEFLDEIPSAPEIHVVFKHSSNVLYVVFCAYTCQYKRAVHDQHCKEHHLKKKKHLNSIFMSEITIVSFFDLSQQHLYKLLSATSTL